MANSVAGVREVQEVTKAIGGLPNGAPTTPIASRPSIARHQRPLLHDLPTKALRSHLQRLPEAAPIVVEEPLIETDTAPGFSALRQASVGRGPIAGMSIDPDTGRLFVVNHTDDSVCALDPTSLTTVASVDGIEEPFAVAVADGRTYVSSVTMSSDAIVALDPSAEEPAIHRVASSVRAFVASPTGRHLYIARTGRDGADVAVLNTVDGRVSTIELGTRAGAVAQSIAISRDGARVYVATTDHLGSELVVIGTDGRGATRVLTGLAFDVPVRDIAVSPDGHTLFVATGDASEGGQGGLVNVVDAQRLSVLDTMDFDGAVTQLLVSAAGERLYALNGDRITVACTATHEIVDTITVVAAPSCIAESADGKKLFIADFDGGVTALTVASSTASLLAKMMAADVSDVIDVSMLELEPAAV